MLCMAVFIRVERSGCVDLNPMWKCVKQTKYVLGN